MSRLHVKQMLVAFEVAPERRQPETLNWMIQQAREKVDDGIIQHSHCIKDHVDLIEVGSILSILFEADNKFYTCMVIKIKGPLYTLKYEEDHEEETLIRFGDNLFEWKSSMDQVDVAQRPQWRHLSDGSVVETNCTVWRFTKEDEEDEILQSMYQS